MAPCAPTAADAAALRAKCEVGASFAMLLQLKGFLKDVYQLSDKKCGEYAPAEYRKLGLASTLNSTHLLVTDETAHRVYVLATPE